MRRDLTINALFYNLNERTVEDMTGKVRAPLQRRTQRVPQPGSAPDPGRAHVRAWRTCALASHARPWTHTPHCSTTRCACCGERPLA